MYINEKEIEGKKLCDLIAMNIKSNDSAIYKLERLARAFATVGNSEVSEQLENIADILASPPRLVQVAYARDLNGQLNHSKEMIGGIMRLIIEDHIKFDE